MSKYKVGDRVLIKSWDNMEKEFGLNINNINFLEDINISRYIVFPDSMKKFCKNIYEVINVDSDDNYTLEGCFFYKFSNDMIERKVNNMTKSDLKSGMIVETRDGSRYITIVKEDGKNYFMNLDGETYFNNAYLFEDMTCVSSQNYNIMKIYNMRNTLNDCKTIKDLIWERKEVKEMTINDIEKKLGYSIKIIKED